jgi:hypothetical protein
MEEHYVADDLILPRLSLPDPCPIRIDITDERISLSIGQRDWGWKRHHPDVTDAGTMLDAPFPEDGPPAEL